MLEVDGGINAATVALLWRRQAPTSSSPAPACSKGGAYADNIAAIRKNAERARAAAA